MNGRNLAKSFGYAWKGIVWSFKHNQNMRIHVALGSLVILAGIFLRLSEYETAIIVVTILFVISSEMINTSIEEMTNLIVSEHRKEAEIAKDVAAGMVLVAAIGSVFVGLVIFLPHLI